MSGLGILSQKRPCFREKEECEVPGPGLIPYHSSTEPCSCNALSFPHHSSVSLSSAWSLAPSLCQISASQRLSRCPERLKELQGENLNGVHKVFQTHPESSKTVSFSFLGGWWIEWVKKIYIYSEVNEKEIVTSSKMWWYGGREEETDIGRKSGRDREPRVKQGPPGTELGQPSMYINSYFIIIFCFIVITER